MKEVLLDKKVVHIGFMHLFAGNGGIIKFDKFPFAIRLSGRGNNYADLQLVAIPDGEVVMTKVEYKKKVKKAPPKINIVEDGEEEI